MLRWQSAKRRENSLNAKVSCCLLVVRRLLWGLAGLFKIPESSLRSRAYISRLIQSALATFLLSLLPAPLLPCGVRWTPLAERQGKGRGAGVAERCLGRAVDTWRSNTLWLVMTIMS